MYMILICFVFSLILKKDGVTYGKSMKTDFQSNEVKKAPYFSLNPSFRKPTFMRYVSNKRHTPGSDVILPCMTSGIRPMTYTWQINGKRIIGKKHRLKFAYNQSMLKIKRIRDIDIGLYTCTSSNPYGNLSYTFNIKLKEKKKQPIFYDYSMMLRKQLSVRPTTESIRFHCQAESLDDVHYIWLKNGKPFRHIKPHEQTNSIISGGDYRNGGDLVIGNLKVNDGGQYSCVAFNRYGNISFTYELRILRKLSGGPPKVIPYTRPQYVHASIGDNVTFECLEIISVTIPDVRWFHLYNPKDRAMLPDVPNIIDWDKVKSKKLPFRSKYMPTFQYTSFKLTSNNNKPKNQFLFDDTDPSGLRLNLINVNTDDTGVYSCYVSNFEGSDYTLFNLTVSANH